MSIFFSDELLSDLLHLPAIQLFFHGGIGWFLSLTQERKVRLCLVDLFSISDGLFMQQVLGGIDIETLQNFETGV